MNTNGDCDADEPVSTASDENGQFTFEDEPADGAIILMKTAGTHNGVPYAFDGLAGVYSGGDIVVSPLTTFQSAGITAAQVAEMFTFAGLSGITAENVATNYMDGLVEGAAINTENLVLLRSAIASYMLFRVLEGSTTLSSLTGAEIYSSAMTDGGEVNSILVAMTGLLENALSEARLTTVQAGNVDLTNLGFPEIIFMDIVQTAVAVADRLSTIGYTGCNDTPDSESNAVKVSNAIDDVTNYVNTHGLDTIIGNISTAFYFARVESQLSDPHKNGAIAANAVYGTYMDCASGTFTLEDDGSVACYAAQ